GLPEDVMTLLYSIYRNYLTNEFLIAYPDFSQLLIIYGKHEKYKDENNVSNALSYIDPGTKEEKDVYLALNKMVINTLNNNDRFVHNYLETHLSDHAFSNFITAGSYRSKNETQYTYNDKSLLLQAAFLSVYL